MQGMGILVKKLSHDKKYSPTVLSDEAESQVLKAQHSSLS